ncbi:RICIN domain-containing protein [Actinokineospora bangkokensis]|uniref:Ricin B lectin domain-containing protein n=1 Tax=Actinokineospora bangkokensis TaxID=1193682 RepID=A0A1Q9LS12_9PSEU|nr:RICIN domain-containing protein [Actinokineospora bangkokensis]OLR94794.1 hypothetical protein BJP25_09160 [Actinokineospora bangkokensis]
MVAATATPASAAVDYQAIQLVNSTLCIQVPGNSTADRIQLATASCGTTASQGWTFTVDSSGSWGELRNKLTGKCMDIRAASKDYDGVVQQYTCSGRDNQKFRFENTGNVLIRNKNSNMCVSAFDNAKPVALTQWGCPINYPYEVWQLIP